MDDTPRHLLLTGAEDFAGNAPDGSDPQLLWHAGHRALQLAGDQRPQLSRHPRTHAQRARHDSRPLLLDTHGQIGLLSDDRRQLLFSLDWPATDPRPVQALSLTGDDDALTDAVQADVAAPPGCDFGEMAIGPNGRLALAYSNGSDKHGLLVVDLGRRWQQRLPLAEPLVALCIDRQNRIWLAGDGWLGLAEGGPLPQDYDARPGKRFEPLQINPHPLRLQWQRPLPAGLQVQALACDDTQLYLLGWERTSSRPGYRQHLLRRSLQPQPGAAFDRWRLRRSRIPFVTDLSVLAENRLALMLPFDADDVSADPPLLDLPVVLLQPGRQRARLLAERWPRRKPLDARFVRCADGVTRYLSDQGPRQLVPLPQARFVAEAELLLREPLDSGTPDNPWHRIYLEACIPPGCSLAIDAQAYDDFASAPEQFEPQPAPLWNPLASELAFAGNRFDSVLNRSGLFEILLQRGDGAVRELRGRYLRLRIRMTGDGRHSPALHALRIQYPRPDWQASWLPAHFHQQQRVQDSPQGPANGADLRQRLLASFEGLLTPIEQRIASAECWLYPGAAPSDRLQPLAQMLGITLPAHWPEQRQRRWLAVAGELAHRRGTFAGLCLALDIACDGLLGAGQIVPVENYRLRRTLATILGIDMDDRDHPLTLGTGQSGNSIVGDSLILSEEQGREFLALFAPELADSPSDRAAVERLFDHYAHRLSVVLHPHARDYRRVIEQVLAEQAPAHLRWRILETDQPFVLGLSPLLGIDTLLQQSPAWRRIVLDDTRLGREALLHNPRALSPAHATPFSPSGDRP